MTNDSDSCVPTNLIWIDLEMTGLDPRKDVIIEIATIITDNKLQILAEGPNLAIKHPKEILAQMDNWNVKQHQASGLSEKVLSSQISLAEAEHQTLEFIKKFVKPRESPMCGNSICQDRRFLHRLMPKLEAYFHYRNLDVSTIKELARYWAPKVFSNLGKNSSHLALEDIRASIAELSYYKQHFLKVE